MHFSNCFCLSSFKVLFVTAPGKENFNVTHDVVVAALVA